MDTACIGCPVVCRQLRNLPWPLLAVEQLGHHHRAVPTDVRYWGADHQPIYSSSHVGNDVVHGIVFEYFVLVVPVDTEKGVCANNLILI